MREYVQHSGVGGVALPIDAGKAFRWRDATNGGGLVVIITQQEALQTKRLNDLNVLRRHR